MAEKRTGMNLPAGILSPTTPPDREPVGPTPAAVEGQGGEPPADAGSAVEARTLKVRKRKLGTTAADKIEGRRLYLSEDVHFRLRMLAYQRGRKISEVAQEVLDKALPRYAVDRVG